LYVPAVDPVVVVMGLNVTVPAPKVDVNNCVGPCPDEGLEVPEVPWLRKFVGVVQVNAGPGVAVAAGAGGSAGAAVFGAVVGVVVALGVGAVVGVVVALGVGAVVVGVALGVVVACAVLGVVVVVGVVDGDAAGVGAAAGDGAANENVPIAKPATRVTQARDIPAFRPSLARRRR